MTEPAHDQQIEHPMGVNMEQLKTIIANTPEHIVMQDRQLRYTFVINPQLGLTEKDMIGKTDAEFLSKEEADRLTEVKTRVLESGQPVNFKTSLVSKMGGTEFYEGTYSPTFDAQDQVDGLIGYFKNVTEREQMEDLQDAIYRIAQAADHAENLNALFPPIHTIIQEVMVADNFYIALYDEKNDLISFPYCVDQVDPLYPPFKPGKGLTEYVLSTGKSLLCDDTLFEELIKQDAVELIGVNSPIWLGVPLIVAGKTIGVMVVQDYQNARAYGEREQRILEFVSSQAAMAIHRKLAEEALRESEARYRAVVEDQPVMYFRFNLDHTITFANQAYCDFHDKQPTEIIGRNLLKLIGEIEKPNVARAGEQIARLTPENPTAVHEHGAVNAHGKLMWFQWRDRLLFDEEGTPLEYQTLGLDITERKQMEEALRESEERFRILSAATFEGIGFSEKGVIVDANQQLADILGYDLNELIGLKVDRFVDPQDMATVRQKIAAGNEEPYEHRSVRKDGSIIFTEVRPRMMPVQGKALRVSVIRDVTERKQAEESLRESEARYRAAVEDQPVMLYRFDLNHTITFANRAYCEFHGKQREEIIGRNLLELVGEVDPTSVPMASENIALLTSENPITSQEHEAVNAHGEQFWILWTDRLLFDKDDQPFEYQTIGLDITERKHAEETLAEQRLFLKQVIDSIPNGILVKDRAGRYILANQTLAEALGSTPEALIGKFETDIYYDKEVAVRFAQEDLEVMDTLQEKFILEQENFHAGGEYRWLQVTKRPLIGLGGKADRVLTVLVNITERKKFEEAMIESQKLAALGTLAAGIAHEINSPLQVITGTSESLQRQLREDKLALEDLPRRLAAINRNAWRVAGIVRSLLSYARPSGGKLDPHDLNVLVKETLLLIEHQLKTWSNIYVITELASGMPALTCDSEKISQVLINLLNNARDAMPNGGDVTIRTRYDGSKKRFTLEVTDNGEGITEEDRSRIFDPFFTTKAVGEGTGLGLSIIQGIIQAHGGEIMVDSAVGVGTSFSIHLPQVPPPALDIKEGGRYSENH